jgi:hypothetical protein
VIFDLNRIGAKRGRDWDMTAQGLVYAKDGSLDDPEFVDQIKEIDQELSRKIGGKRKKSNLGVGQFSDENQKFNPDESYAWGASYIFIFPDKASREELAVRRMFSNKLIDVAEKEGFKKGVFWSIGPRIVDFGSVHYNIINKRYPESEVIRFEALVSSIDDDCRLAIGAVKTRSSWAAEILGEEGYTEVENSYRYGPESDIREYLSQDNVFGQLDFSDMEESDVEKVAKALRSSEMEDSYNFHQLKDRDKPDIFQTALSESGVIPGFAQVFFRSDRDSMILFPQFLDLTLTNRTVHNRFSEVAAKYGLKTPPFGSRFPMYASMVALNKMDAVKVDAAISEAYYDLERFTGSEDEGEKAIAIAYNSLFSLLIPLKDSLEFRQSSDDREKNATRRRRYGLFVNYVLSSFMNQLVTSKRDPEIASVLSIILSDPIPLIRKYETFESMERTPVVGRVKTLLSEFIHKKLSSFQQETT